jgi:hypothetical protein
MDAKRFCIVGIALLFGAGCTPAMTSNGIGGGGGGDGGGSDGGGSDGGGEIGHHEPLPLVPNQGGKTLSALQLVTITFSADPNSSQDAGFGDFVVGSSWLKTVGADYGLQSATHVKKVQLTQNAGATVTDAQIQSLIASQIQNGTLPSGDQVLYLIYYPPGTTVQSAFNGADTCVDLGGGEMIGGYHWEGKHGVTPFSYSVVPTCKNESLADIQSSASHELMEGTTDPLPYSSPAWVLADMNNPWSYLDGEVGDFCEGYDTTESGYRLTRIWSNTAAKAGDRDPCIPAPSTPYYNVTATPSTVQTIAPGQSVTLELEAWASVQVPPWMLSASTLGGGSFMPQLSLDVSSIGPGQTAHLTVTVPSGTASQSSALIFVGSRASKTEYNYWPLVVSAK